MSKMIDLTGQQFGYWTVKERAENSKDGRAQWLCICKCGNEKIISGKILRNGHSKSCGCFKKENPGRLLDLTGQTFGHLKAIELMPRDFNDKLTGSRYWKCKCDCGNIHYVTTNRLTSGAVQSCGCTSVSRGEEQIASLLKANHIPYETEKTFQDCRFENNYLARFDFYVNNQYIIEYDGIQHSSPKAGWNLHRTDGFEKVQQHDKYKNIYCFENNIPIIRIPYTKEGKIVIEDLLLETSSFIMRKPVEVASD